MHCQVTHILTNCRLTTFRVNGVRINPCFRVTETVEFTHGRKSLKLERSKVVNPNTINRDTENFNTGFGEGSCGTFGCVWSPIPFSFLPLPYRRRLCIVKTSIRWLLVSSVPEWVYPYLDSYISDRCVGGRPILRCENFTLRGSVTPYRPLETVLFLILYTTLPPSLFQFKYFGKNSRLRR